MDTVRRAPAGRVIDVTDSDPSTALVPPAHSHPDAKLAALASFENAVQASSGYRGWLAECGVDPAEVTAIDQVPYLTKADVFSGDLQPWLDGGDATAAAELLTSSGHSGSFSVGLTSRAEAEQLPATIDAALAMHGANGTSSTLLLNCLPMGITLPSTVATVATPSVHLEMAQELFERFRHAFERTVIVAEPVVFKELAECIREEREWARVGGPVRGIVGGEWVAESWRRHVEGLLRTESASGADGSAILLSMGAAELGLHLLFETPQLRTLRRLLDDAQHALPFDAHDFGYTPSLFTFDPRRVHVETRRHDDGVSTLVVTPLERRLLPLVRYDLDDVAQVVPAERVNEALGALGAAQRFEQPVVAVWGRRRDSFAVADRRIRPELVKQWLFADVGRASTLTGRFHIVGGAHPTLHLQGRDRRTATASVRDDARAFLHDIGATHCRVAVHDGDAYPFHAAGDYQHKPVYGSTP